MMKIEKDEQNEGTPAEIPKKRPIDEVVVTDRWVLPGFGFFWFINIRNEEMCLAYSCVHVNDEERERMEDISKDELIAMGAVKDKKWKPMVLREAMKTIPKTPDGYLMFLE